MARPASHPAERLHALLRTRGATVATAESLTGGQLAALLTAVPGASATYVGGVVSYATSVKVDLLGVSPELVAEHGVISAACAAAMARGAIEVTGATYGLSTTGVAGPAEQEGHQAGTVYVGVAGPGLSTAVSLELVGDRATIQERTCTEALSVLDAILREEETGLG